MWTVPPPTRQARDAFRTCIGSVRSDALKDRLEAIEPIVVRSSREYATAATENRIHTVPQEAAVGGSVTTKEMVDLYSGRMAKQGSSGREIYDELLSAPANGRCPLCGQRTVSTLDHNLPKSRHPSLAVTPQNLVPACVECNRVKGDHAPRVGSEETIHPYFDDVDGEVWLHADVLVGAPAAVTFAAVAPAAWDAVLAARVGYHFRLFNLATLYAAHAGEELLNIKHQLSDLHARAGSTEVRAELLARSRSYGAIHTNSWQVAMYRGLAGSQWFCEEGFAA